MKVLKLTLIAFAAIFTAPSCKQDQEFRGNYNVINDTDFAISLVNFALPNSGASPSIVITKDTTYSMVNPKSTLSTTFADHSGFPNTPWQSADNSTVLVFSDSIQLVLTDSTYLPNDIRLKENWVIEVESSYTTTFTYRITEADYNRALAQ